MTGGSWSLENGTDHDSPNYTWFFKDICWKSMYMSGISSQEVPEAWQMTLIMTHHITHESSMVFVGSQCIRLEYHRRRFLKPGKWHWSWLIILHISLQGYLLKVHVYTWNIITGGFWSLAIGTDDNLSYYTWVFKGICWKSMYTPGISSQEVPGSWKMALIMTHHITH